MSYTLDLGAPTSSISLNAAAPLVLLAAVLVHSAEPNERGCPSSTSYNEQRELVTLEFGREFPRGKAVLALRWEGRLDAGTLLGYYEVPEKEIEGAAAGHYAVTQFQPTNARRAFPCFDHPEKKATFAISLLSPAGLNSLCNTPEVSRSPSNGAFPTSAMATADFLAGSEGKLATEAERNAEEGLWDRIVFETTPAMSTYLVAWAVGSFSSLSSSYASPLTDRVVPLRIYASTSLQHIERGQAQLALDTLAKIMPIYEKLFDIPYPLGKLDLLVCDALGVGAMENWGLITGRTSSFLYDDVLSGVAAKFTVVRTVAHEASHLWFGDLVTFKWWNDLWLNEGFATLMGEVLVLDAIEPTWNVHSQIIKFHRTSALQLDALRHSHPVEMSSKDDSEAATGQTFDSISYEKGSAILKMLSHYLGDEAFVRGTSMYLKAHMYSNTASQDLWTSMSEASGVDVANLMDSWVTKVGFPVITVEETSEGIRLRQNRFLSSGDPTPDEDATLWTIPLNIKTVGSASEPRKVLMVSRELLLPSLDAAFSLNAETSGLCGFSSLRVALRLKTDPIASTVRVCYPPSILAKLATEAGKPDSALSLADRLGILQDVILLSEAGYTRTSSSLDFMMHLVHDGEYLVWIEIAIAFSRILDAWWEQPEEVLAGVKAFARSLFEPLLEKLGFVHLPDDDTEARLFRVLVIAASAAADCPSVISHLQQSFMLLASGQGDATSADLAFVIVGEAVKHGAETQYGIALAIYNAPPTPQHQLAAIAGLTSTRSPALIQPTAAMLMSGQVEEQNMLSFLVGLAENPLSRRMVWQFLQGAWAGLEVQLAGSLVLGKLVQICFQSFSSEEDAASVEAFFADKDCTAFIQPLEQGLETVRAKARWLSRDGEDVKSWLSKNGFLAAA